MKDTTLQAVLVLSVSCALASCATTGSSSQIGGEVTSDSYAQRKNAKGVVVMAINWGRKWGCGTFENAELRSIAFDRVPVQKAADDQRPDLLLDGPLRLIAKPIFVDYALLVEPGEYALSGFNIKVARSASDVGYIIARRSELVKDGQPQAGSFTVGAGEIVYIGNFFLDCTDSPTLWRYYSEGREGFRTHMGEVKQKYPFLDLDKVQYRLFHTTVLGHEYQLQ